MNSQAKEIPEKMKAVYLIGRKQLEVREIPVPSIPHGGALIKVLSTGLCGSDINRILYTTSDEERVLGHEVVGEIISIDTNTTAFNVGDRVAIAHVHIPCGHCTYCKHGSPAMCRQFKKSRIEPGGYAEYVAATNDHLAHTIIAVPDNVSDAAATFADPLGCCMRAVRQSDVIAFDKVVVVGAGIMGQLFVMYLSQLNINTFVIDVSDHRLNLAKSLGANHLINPKNTDAVKCILEATDGQGVDSVMMTFLTQDILNQAMEYTRDGSHLCVFAPPLKDLNLSLDFFAFFRREMKMYGSYSSNFDEFEDTLNWIASKKVAVERLITGTVDLDGLVTAVQNLSDKDLKIIVKP